MGSIALLAKELGYKVTGSDHAAHPPISTMLEKHGIHIMKGYDLTHLKERPDLIIIGNTKALARGNPVTEFVLNEKIPFTSAPEWIYSNILKDRWVIAVSGTHGKTTTTSMIVWIMERAGLKPGYLIGGVPNGLQNSTRLSPESEYFVIEADEYGTAFFDQRPKMCLYHPKTLVINNLEMDHADIYADLAEIELQFHRLIKMLPGNGLIVHPTMTESIQRVIAKGCWTPTETTGENGNWTTKLLSRDGSLFEVFQNRKLKGTISWELLGNHSVANALSAIAAVNHIGVSPEIAIEALCSFKYPKRRLEKIGQVGEIEIILDFGHHPTAIQANLKALRERYGEDAKIYTAIDLSTSSMKLGLHKETLLPSTSHANFAFFWKTAQLDWDIEKIWENYRSPCQISQTVDEIMESFLKMINNNVTDKVIFIAFSSSSFDNLPQKLMKRLQNDCAEKLIKREEL
ncbi:unnamed protein product, partial [Mesorhabditis belari]|uniref:UDP-N-acetylmuramate:L-alanyl-gamma-D-glutamyl-meso-diaminopimelate ligase n=1 Tax=Mesorhabditis belari TaxID=2138241 RepID=A0AAF3EGP0_9BILA